MNDTNKGVNPFWTTAVYLTLSMYDLLSSMSTKSLNRTSDIIETPRVNVDILMQKIIDQKKKDKLKNTIIFSTVLVSISALTYLTY